jgi:hypothetical protein
MSPVIRFAQFPLYQNLLEPLLWQPGQKISGRQNEVSERVVFETPVTLSSRVNPIL